MDKEFTISYIVFCSIALIIGGIMVSWAITTPVCKFPPNSNDNDKLNSCIAECAEKNKVKHDTTNWTSITSTYTYGESYYDDCIHKKEVLRKAGYMNETEINLFVTANCSNYGK